MPLERWLYTVPMRLRTLFRRRRVDEELDEELRCHIEEQTRQYVAAGLSPVDARLAARRALGGLEQRKEECRDFRGLGAIDSVARDVTHAVRLFLRQRTSSAVAVLTLALGIGMSTMLFSVIDAVWLRPLPYPHPEELVSLSIAERQPDGRSFQYGPSIRDVREWRAHSGLLAQIGTGRTNGWLRVVDGTDSGEPDRVLVGEAGEGFLEVFGIVPQLGRAVAVDDGRPGAPAVVLLGDGYWRSHFGASPAVVGRPIQVDETTATVIGVLPRGFLPNVALWWTPQTAAAEDRRGSGRSVYARLRPGLTLAHVERELSALAIRLSVESGEERPGGVSARSLYESTTAQYRLGTRVLGGATLLIVLIACVNVAGLLLARGATRQHELAVRASLGAGRGRLLRQLLTEALVLAIAGAVLGTLLAWVSLDAFVSLVPLSLPENVTAALNVRVLAVTAWLAVAIAIGCGLVPALRLSRVRPGSQLTGASRLHGAVLSRRGGQCLIAAEVALAIVLLAGAGLMVRTFSRLMSVDLGFDPAAVLTMDVAPVGADREARGLYYTAVIERIRALPGVESASAVDRVPLGGAATSIGAFGEAPDVVQMLRYQALSGFFEVLGLRVTEGRPLRAEDHGRPVVVLSQMARRQLFPNGPAIGRSIDIMRRETREVVGVVNDVRHNGPHWPEEVGAIYVPAADGGGSAQAMTIVVRPRAGQRGPLGDHLRAVARAPGSRVVVSRVQSGSELLGERVSAQSRRMTLLSLLGGLGLLLTLVGVFSVTSYAVARRTQEIGVRMAFGAQPGEVVRRMARDAIAPTVVGVACGLGLTMYVTAGVAPYLFETSPRDPATFTAVAGLVIVCGSLAAWLPARRAARVDPISALREE